MTEGIAFVETIITVNVGVLADLCVRHALTSATSEFDKADLSLTTIPP